LEAALADVFQSAGKQQSWTLVLAPDTAPPFVLECPQGIRSVTELAQLARVRAARLFGGVPLDWEIAADWQLKSPTLCAAAPAQVLSAVQTTAHGEAAGGRGRRDFAVLFKAVVVCEA
jgi:hypothetical protein